MPKTPNGLILFWLISNYKKMINGSLEFSYQDNSNDTKIIFLKSIDSKLFLKNWQK